MRRRLRDLTKFIDRQGGRENVYTDFEDDLGEEREIDGLIRRDENLKNYRLKVGRFMQQNELHPAIVRIRRNQPISSADIEALEVMLFGEERRIPQHRAPNRRHHQKPSTPTQRRCSQIGGIL